MIRLIFPEIISPFISPMGSKAIFNRNDIVKVQMFFSIFHMLKLIMGIRVINYHEIDHNDEIDVKESDDRKGIV